MTDMRKLRADLPPFASDGFYRPGPTRTGSNLTAKKAPDMRRPTPAVVALPSKRTYETGGFRPMNANDRAARKQPTSGFAGWLSRFFRA